MTQNPDTAAEYQRLVAEVETVPFDCMDCGEPMPAGQFTTGHGCQMPADELVPDAIVRLSHMYGSKALHKIAFRVTTLPDPKASRKAQRECYGVTPIAGGRDVFVPAAGLIRPKPADLTAAAAITPAERLDAGVVCVVRSPKFHRRGRGSALVVERDYVVVTKVNPDGTVAIAELGGGTEWGKVPLAALRRVNLPDSIVLPEV